MKTRIFRVKPVLNEPWVNDGAYFDGTGYAEIPLPSSETNQKRFEQEVRVLSHSGILLLLQDQVSAAFLVQVFL